MRNGITKFAAVLFATAMFTGCVEDNESASVTNIRDVKAAQLTALAELSKAQAEAVLVTANAEAALINAQIAYQAALTAASGLENQLFQVALDKASANLMLEIEIAKTQAEATLASAKAGLELAKAQLVAALDLVAEAEKVRIEKLLGQYDTLLSDINDLRIDLIDFEGQLIAAETGLIKAENVREAAITASKVKIATSKAEIVHLKLIALSADQQAAAELELVTAKENLSKQIVKLDGLNERYLAASKADLHASLLIAPYGNNLDLQLAYVNASIELTKYYQDIITYKDVIGYYYSAPGADGVVFRSEVTGAYRKINVDVELLDSHIAELTIQIPGITDDLEDKEAMKMLLAKLEELRENLVGNAEKEYNEAIKDYLVKAEAKGKTELDVLVVDLDVLIAAGVVNSTVSIISDINNTDEAILLHETAIAKEEGKIEDVSKIETKENAIVWIKEQIATTESELKIKEGQAIELKSQIDTLVATAK